MTADAWRCDLHGAACTRHDERPACFYCRRGMHSACVSSGEFPCRCCDGGSEDR
jgi:hypothetical protein